MSWAHPNPPFRPPVNTSLVLTPHRAPNKFEYISTTSITCVITGMRYRLAYHLLVTYRHSIQNRLQHVSTWKKLK